MSTPELSTHVGQGCGPELQEDNQSLSVLKIEDKMRDDITPTGAVNAVVLQEDANHHSADEPINSTVASEAKPCTGLKIDRLNDPTGKIFLQNFMRAIQAAREQYSDDDESDDDEPVKVSGAAIDPKSWAEQSSGQNSGHTTDADCPELPTHPGQPWESDEEEEFDSDYDDDKETSRNEYGGLTHDGSTIKTSESATHETAMRKAVSYKTPFGRITLDEGQDPVVSSQGCTETEQTHQNAVAPLTHDGLATLNTTESSSTMEDNDPEIEKTCPHSVTAPIGPIADPESFRNEFYEVKKSETAGYGAFALRKLVKGQTILVEKSLFHGDNSTLRSELKKLAPELRQAFDRMHGHSLTDCSTILLKRLAIFKTNSFMVNQWDRGVFLTASKFNHACRPKNNVAYTYDRRHDCMVFTVERDIEAGGELFITYGKDPETLYKHYGFLCRCGGCKPLTEKEVSAFSRLWW